MNCREMFLQVVEDKLGLPVLWGRKGPEVFDCSGLVTWALLGVGGPDLRQTHNAQALFNRTRPLISARAEAPKAGDLVFYGNQRDHIIHVAVVDQFGGVISADGATPKITQLVIATANPHNRVTRHPSIRYRQDCKFVSVNRNTLVDVLDKVCV